MVELDLRVTGDRKAVSIFSCLVTCADGTGRENRKVSSYEGKFKENSIYEINIEANYHNATSTYRTTSYTGH
jgi:hypothetical protein